jgi:hypothetical protein
VRAREAGLAALHHGAAAREPELVRRDYAANGYSAADFPSKFLAAPAKNLI